MNKIPSVDLKDFLSEDENRKQKFINEIGHAYENIGFVALKGHFLDDNLVDDLYAQIKNFFDLPEDVKQKYEIPGIGGQRGYVSFGKESAKGKKEGDLKEFWHFGQYVDADSKYANEYPENVTVELGLLHRRSRSHLDGDAAEIVVLRREELHRHRTADQPGQH